VAYRADIEIAVKGAQELKRLGDQISATGKLVDGLNKDLENIGGGGVVRNINNLNETVGKAAAAFNEAALGTQEATLAAKNYIAATEDLNTGLRERLALLKQVNDAERQQRLGAAGIREATQYGGPIGPGPASSVLGGQSTPVDEQIRRNLEGRKDELLLQQALLALEEKSAAVANKELQARGEIARLAAQGVNAAAFRAAQTGTPLALPAFQERGLRLLDDAVKLNESSRRIEQGLNGERARGVRFLEKQTAEERRQVELGILGARTGALPGTARARGTVPTGGFPVSGPLQSPGFRKTQQSVGKFGENLALGAGFPLLFGGGAGSVAGSVLGSFVGPGFGGQILGGALGQILDQAVQKAAQLGTALQKLDLTALEESGIRVNANLENQVRLLLQTGQLTAAQAALQQQVTATTGALPGTVEGVSDAVNVLNAAWSEFTAATSVTLGILAAPFAAALGAVLTLVNTIVKGFNVAVSALGAAIKVTGEWIVSLLAGDNALKKINDSLKANNAEIEKARSAYIPILSSLNGEVLLNRDLLNLEAQKTAARTAADKQRNVSLDYQQKLLQINADYDQKIREENEKTNEANKNQVEEAVRLLNVRRAQSIEEAKIAGSIATARILEEERTRLAREAEQAARKAEQARQNALSIFKEEIALANQINSLYVEQVEAQVRGAAFVDNEAAGILKQLSFTDKVYDAKKAILENDKEAALVSAKTQKQEAGINEIYERRLAILNVQTSLEKESAERRFNVLVQTPTDAERSLTSVQEEINLLNAKLNGQEKEYRQKLAIDALVAAGVPVAAATAEVEVRDALNERLRTQLQLQQQLEDLLNQVGSTLGSVFQQLIFSTDSWTDSLRNALNALANILFQAGLSGLAGTDGVGFFSFLTGTLRKRAKGGPVTGGSPYIVGERGPELFVPGAGGTIVPNDKLGGGGGEVNVVVNVDASGSKVEGDEQEGKQLGRVIAAAIQQELVKQKRPGGLLA
jgi:hypothetical protein